jgi:thioredoxin reductase/bacterioferritin-associated ferredoxin
MATADRASEGGAVSAPREVELAIVGGGPAGLSAAMEAARAGVQVTLIDEAPQLGGQIYRQLPPTFRVTDPAPLGTEYRRGRALLEAFAGQRVELLTNTLVWGIFEDKWLALATGDRAASLRARALVIAIGAYDRPVPFPGWTLPGVFTAGGAQAFVKSQRVLPGRRALLVGTGPLQLVVATQLAKAGMTVAGLVELSRMERLWRFAPRVWRHVGMLWEGFEYWRALKKFGIPILTGHVIVRAEGDDELRRATVAEADERGRPVPGTERAFDVDTLCVGYGFVPSTELGRLAGCEHRFAPAVGGWIPAFDPRTMETTRPGLYVAGDGAGVAGAAVAVEEGRLAGISAARALGRLAADEAEARAAPVRRALAWLGEFRSVMDELYGGRPDIAALATPETIVCRCEEVARRELDEVIGAGALTLNEVKAMTRLGMGRCQGRMCGPSAAALLAAYRAASEEAAGLFTPRPPVRPVPLGVLATLE